MNEEKFDIQREYVDEKTGVNIAYHVYDKPKTREEMTTAEYAHAVAIGLHNSEIEAKRSIIEKEIRRMESEIRLEKANNAALNSMINSIFCICRRALEDGKFDKNAYEIMSILYTEGATNDYIPKYKM